MRQSPGVNPVRRKRKQREAKKKDQIRPKNSVGHRLDFINQIVVVDPINPDLYEGQQVQENRRLLAARRPAIPSWSGAFNSSTMIVMMTAITPSENASRARWAGGFCLLIPIP